MEQFKRILVVSRDTRQCRSAVQFGVSFAKIYGAELYVIHVIHDPFRTEGWLLSVPSLEKEYQRMVERTRAELSATIEAETQQGMPIKELLREGDPVKEISRVVEEERIDLIILHSHEEGRLEHFLFGRSNESLLRSMPCPILMVRE